MKKEGDAQKDSWIDYLDVKWKGEGWYYRRNIERYYRGNTIDTYNEYIPADLMVEEIRDKMKELADELREAKLRQKENQK